MTQTMKESVNYSISDIEMSDLVYHLNSALIAFKVASEEVKNGLVTKSIEDALDILYAIGCKKI